MPSATSLLYKQAKILAKKFVQGGGRKDIDDAINLDREALKLCPPGHPKRATSLNRLSFHLRYRYGKLRTMADLEEAILLCEEALALRPSGAVYLHNLASYLCNRSDHLGAMVDLEDAIVLYKESLALRPPGNAHRPGSLSSLAMSIFVRYEKLGAMADLEDAIVLHKEALALCPQGHPHRSTCLNELADYLSDRYHQLREMVDLEEAIAYCKEALVLSPQGYPQRLTSLDNLAHCLSHRHEKLGEVVDVEDAIVLCRDALALCPPGHPLYSTYLNTLASRLFDRCKQSGAIADLEEAIVVCKKALVLCPQGHPDRSDFWIELASHFFYRYEQLETMVDLEEAIILGKEALVLRPSGHPGRSTPLKDLSRYFSARYKQLNQLEDKEKVFDLYSQTAHIRQTVSFADLSAARAWICMAEDFQHITRVLAYKTYLRFVVRHLATLPPLPQYLKVLQNTISSLAVDTFSACLRDQSPRQAVELLEQGRGIFWNQLNRLSSPLDDIIASGPEGKALADKFARLTSLIHKLLGVYGADQHDRMWHLGVELETVVSDIRELPRLSRFLLPSLFSDLQQAAIGGPVIIVNASTYGCDALVILLNRDPVHIPLKITKDDVQALSSQLGMSIVRSGLMDVTREFAGILRELWDRVVSPIVDFIQTAIPFHSRIWWCPTAEFCALPLHAAGAYRRGQRKLSDLYISSYTTTLAALIRARREEPSISTTQQKRFVAIGQTKAAGESELHSVGAELANIGQRVQSLATLTIIEGTDACISRVVKELGKNEWVHLACHGIPNRKEPFKSAFALHDGHLTVEHVIQRKLPNAEFAYLSACHTTFGDEDSPDEMTHLASAMQSSGFRSVIGTMWAVDDRATIKIASTFYDNVKDELGRLDRTRAALALHKTMKVLDGISLDQRVLYVHLGV